MFSPVLRFALVSITVALVSVKAPQSSFGQNGLVFPDQVDPPTIGEVRQQVKRVLVVFVRFKDDSLRLEGCTEAARAWREPDSLPAFADYIFASDTIPPFDSRSLTDYFYRQSGGQLLLFGETYPDVFVTAFEYQHYAGSTGKIVLGPLAKEVLIHVDEDPRTDLSDFDVNNDGYLDYVIGVLRSSCELSLTPSGASGIATLGYQSATPEFGNDPDNLKKARFFMGTWVIYDNAGNIFPALNLFRLIAHEMGHLFVNGVHLKPIAGAFGVPANDPSSLAYFLMLGRGDCAGSLTMSAMERDLRHVGWIKCQKLTRDTTVVVRDLYSADSSNCFRVGVLGPEENHANLYLSNMQRVGEFDRLRTESCYGVQSDHGLMTTGLLATMVDRNFHVSVLAADNSIELGLLAFGYDGDMFGPPSATQLTPWTTPNVHGLSTYPSDYVLESSDFVAIDSIRYSASDARVIEFDYRSDFRHSPTFRSNSQIGHESAGVELHGQVRVADRSTLDLHALSSVRGMALVEEGSSLHVHGGAEVEIDSLYLRRGSRLSVDGNLTITRLLENDGGTISVGEGGQLTNLGIETVPDPSDCAAVACTFTLEAFPNPFSGSLVIEIMVPSPAHLSVAVFDALGRDVARPVTGRQFRAGRHLLTWRPETEASGVYLIRGQSGSTVRTTSAVYVR